MTTRVATVAGTAIDIERVEARIAGWRRGPRARHLPPDDRSGEVRRWIVRHLVDEEILLLECRALGIVEPAAERLSAADVGRLVEHVAAGVSVAESEVEAYYNRNRDLFCDPEARRIRHVAAATWRRARDTDASTAPATTVRRDELTGPLEDAIFAADVGALVGPIRTELGWHVALIEAVIPETAIPYEQARIPIERELVPAARARAFDDWLDDRRNALAAFEAAFEHPGHPVHGVPGHRH